MLIWAANNDDKDSVEQKVAIRRQRMRETTKFDGDNLRGSESLFLLSASCYCDQVLLLQGTT